MSALHGAAQHSNLTRHAVKGAGHLTHSALTGACEIATQPSALRLIAALATGGASEVAKTVMSANSGVST